MAGLWPWDALGLLHYSISIGNHPHSPGMPRELVRYLPWALGRWCARCAERSTSSATVGTISGPRGAAASLLRWDGVSIKEVGGKKIGAPWMGTFVFQSFVVTGDLYPPAPQKKDMLDFGVSKIGRAREWFHLKHVRCVASQMSPTCPDIIGDIRWPKISKRVDRWLNLTTWKFAWLPCNYSDMACK